MDVHGGRRVRRVGACDLLMAAPALLLKITQDFRVSSIKRQLTGKWEQNPV